jgi:hypothetical protein
MGRAFRVVKRTAHLTVQVAERPVRRRAPQAPTKPRARKTAGAASTQE